MILMVSISCLISGSILQLLQIKMKISKDAVKINSKQMSNVIEISILILGCKKKVILKVMMSI